jgi:hypothetical protein
MDVVNRFFEQSHYDKTVFADVITTEALRSFEQSTKVGINIYYIDHVDLSSLDTNTYQCIMMITIMTLLLTWVI